MASHQQNQQPPPPPPLVHRPPPPPPPPPLTHQQQPGQAPQRQPPTSSSQQLPPPVTMPTHPLQGSHSIRPPPPMPPREAGTGLPSSSNARSSPTKATSPPASSQPRSLDEMADVFLTSSSSTNSITHPLPLVKHKGSNDVDRLRQLVTRRAWADVRQFSQQLLHGPSSHYATLFDAVNQSCSALRMASDGLMMTDDGSTTTATTATTTATTNQMNEVAVATASLNSMALDTHQDDLSYILTMHMQALVHLRLYDDLTATVRRWHFCHHHHHHGGTSSTNGTHASSTTASLPSWMKWSVHIAAASTLQFRHLPNYPKPQNTAATPNDAATTALNDPKASLQACIDALTAIRAELLLVNPSTTTAPTNNVVWAICQVEHALSNVFVQHKDWRMALWALERLLERVEDAAEYTLFSNNIGNPKNRNSPQASTVSAAEMAHCYRAELLSRQGRILLQAGCLEEAERVFDRATQAWNTVEESSKTKPPSPSTMAHGILRHVPAQLKVNAGLLKFSYGKFDEAYEFYRLAVEHMKETFANESSSSNDSKTFESNHMDAIIVTDTLRQLYSETVNNLSVCALYLCRLSDALQLLESLVQENVTQYLTSRVALNLCTMYELASDSTASSRKKKVLQLIARRFALQDIAPESFRVS